MDKKQALISSIVSKLPSIEVDGLSLLSRIAEKLDKQVEVSFSDVGYFNKSFCDKFAAILLSHHTLSSEPFSKDKFEHAMVRTLKDSGVNSELAPRGNPGHDINVEDERWSLKTQADKAIKKDYIHISKFMELGKGDWTDVNSLIAFCGQMLSHMEGYERIFTLRHLIENGYRYYELVEIPQELLRQSKSGEFGIRDNSKQTPKPGVCCVTDDDGELKYQLYFDGGSERKLQIQKIRKSLCIVHASWKFEIA